MDELSWDEPQSFTNHMFGEYDPHFFFSPHKPSALGISKSKEIERILNLSTIKLGELFEDTTSTQCNHAFFVLVKGVKNIFQTQCPPLHTTHSMYSSIS